MNAAFTAPFQNDGRAPTLEAQALAAMHDHSPITTDPSPQRPARTVGFQTHLVTCATCHGGPAQTVNTEKRPFTLRECGLRGPSDAEVPGLVAPT